MKMFKIHVFLVIMVLSNVISMSGMQSGAQRLRYQPPRPRMQRAIGQKGTAARVLQQRFMVRPGNQVRFYGGVPQQRGSKAPNFRNIDVNNIPALKGLEPKMDWSKSWNPLTVYENYRKQQGIYKGFERLFKVGNAIGTVITDAKGQITGVIGDD